MTLLKESTSELHRKAEQMPFNLKMFEGLLSHEAYFNYLVQQKGIFEALEKHELPHPGLNRSRAIQEDLEEFSDLKEADFPLLSSTQAYVNHLDQLSAADQLPHVYLNYLAIAFGGQIMKTKVPSKGKMYDFENPREVIASIRAVQKDEWVDEVNTGYQHIIDIFDELDHVSHLN